MITLILTLLAVLVLVVYVRYENVSPKLVVKEAASSVGFVVGATPEVVKTTVALTKAANANAELALKEAGEQGPLGFKEGVTLGRETAEEFFATTNEFAKETFEEAERGLKAYEARQREEA